MFRIAWIFYRVNALNELQYRVNFFVQFLRSLVTLATGFIGLEVVFSHTNSLGGWTRPELLAVLGVYTMMGGLINATILPSMQQLLLDVQQGTLDYTLTKPADSQLQVSVRRIEIWSAVDMLLGLGVLIYAQFQMGINLWQALLFLSMLVSGGLIIYSFWLIMSTGTFWVIRMDSIQDLFQGVYTAGRWPVTIYPSWLQAGLTFLVPVAFAVTVPAEAVTGRLTGMLVVETLVLTVLLLCVSRWFWKFGLRHYSGASA